MELDKEYIKNEILTIPGVREGIRSSNYKEVFNLCRNIKKQRQLALSLYYAKVDFLKYLDSIPDTFFTGATDITELVIPGNIKVIGALAFANSSLAKVTIEEGVEQIKDGAFAHTKVSEIHLPKSINSLGDYALGKSRVYCYLTKEDLDKPTFNFGSFTTGDVINADTGEVIKSKVN